MFFLYDKEYYSIQQQTIILMITIQAFEEFPRHLKGS